MAYFLLRLKLFLCWPLWLYSFNSFIFLTSVFYSGKIHLLLVPQYVPHYLFSFEYADCISSYTLYVSLFSKKVMCIFKINPQCPSSLFGSHASSLCSGCGEHIPVSPKNLVCWPYFCCKTMYYWKSKIVPFEFFTQGIDQHQSLAI